MQKIAYCGTLGSYAFLAAQKAFPGDDYMPFPSFESAFYSVEAGNSDFAVLPIKNSYAGPVQKVKELVEKGSLTVLKNIEFPIDHCLVASPRTRSISEIKKVLSHPQALSQCDTFIKEHNFETVPFSNTALGAQCVKAMDDTSVAAIASEETAKIFGLKIIEKNIETAEDNHTTFVVLNKKSA